MFTEKAPVAQLDRAADYGSETTHFACSHDFDGNKAKQRSVRLRTILTFTGFSERYHIFRQKKTQKKHTSGSAAYPADPLSSLLKKKEVYYGK